ncbi:DNRLRE domain-containing protein [Desulfobacterales bacterium HSG17]|nr:DNRLRE domain-containing protein [Desulfobacterales bacterium HSG17]
MKKFRFYLTTLIIIMLFNSTAMANIWYVSPFQNIQDTINISNTGDIIYVQDGVYYENLNFMGKSLTLASYYGLGNGTSHIGNTIIDGEQNGRVVDISNCDSAMLIGLTIRNGSTSGRGGGINAYQCPRLFIDRCIIEGNSADTGGGISLYRTSANITRCIIRDNIAEDDGGGIATFSSGPVLGLDGNPDDRIVINNCLIVNNEAQDVHGSMGGGGIRLISYDTRVLNCTISHNSTPNNNGGGISMNHDPIISNSIIWDNFGNDLDTYTGVNPNVSYCNVGAVYMGSGNISTDPLFGSGTNYFLSSSSPCINAGDPNSTIPPLLSIDLIDTPRILGIRVDIGAYEWMNTLTLQPDDGIDAHLSSLYPDQNYGDHQDLNAAAWTSRRSLSNVRNVILFEGIDSIPPGAQILSAKLSLFNNPTASNGFLNGEHSSYSGSNESVIKRVTSQWYEYDVTWNTQPSTTSLNEAIVPQSTNPNQDYEIDVTDMVNDMINFRNFGFLLKLETEIRYRCLLFASSDHPDSNLHPKLEISYY